jgi:hypothetical protein
MATVGVAATLRERPSYRTALLLPYLNRQALVEDEGMLLCLLHNRTAFPPSEWATLDLQLSYFGRHSGLLGRTFNEMCFSIRDSNYGAASQYDEKLFHDGALVGFPNAQILFEAQQYL